MNKNLRIEVERRIIESILANRLNNKPDTGFQAKPEASF